MQGEVADRQRRELAPAHTRLQQQLKGGKVAQPVAPVRGVMTITLTAEMAQAVRTVAKAGEYVASSEIIREAGSAAGPEISQNRNAPHLPCAARHFSSQACAEPDSPGETGRRPRAQTSARRFERASKQY
jgi:hypothetical protein